MKLNYQYVLIMPIVTRRVILAALFFLAAILNVHAQLSGLAIASSGEVMIDPKGKVTINAIERSTAVLRKLVNQEKKQQIIEAKDPLLNNVVTPAKEIKSSLNVKNIPAPVITTSGTLYDIPGSTSLHQYTSLQAEFKFIYEMHGLSAHQYNTFNVTQAIELYKMENGNNVRSFCIPSGSCNSVNVPIQITGNGLRNAPGNTGNAGNPAAYFTVAVPSRYLQPGEYVFIDKSSLTADGTSLACFAFTVKQ